MVYPSPRRSDSTIWPLQLAVLLGLMLAWRLWTLQLSALDLQFDEAQYWAWSQEPAFGYFSKPPMIAWVIGVTTSLCGHGESCVRLGAPILHAASSGLIYLAGARLHDRRTGFWSALAFALAPGVSYSSTLISTDVPLLFFWSGALLAWIHLQQRRSWPAAIALGLCLGLGLLSKYAMLYFVLCAAIWLILDPSSRWLLRDRRLVVILVLAGLLIAPNIGWNLANGLVTYSHTAENAAWRGNLLHPVRALEFFAAQFGVFGPILFGALVWIAIGAVRQGAPRATILLLAFSLPVLLLILAQAFLSRAYANWAAVAYPAAAILVSETLIRNGCRQVLAMSLALHLVAQGALTYGQAHAATLALPGRIDPFWRSLGWRDSAGHIREAVENGAYRAIVTTNRHMSAELSYYLRDLDIPLRALPDAPVPQDHFQLTRPYGGEAPALLVAGAPQPPALPPSLRSEPAGSFKVAAGAKKLREVYLFALTRAESR